MKLMRRIGLAELSAQGLRTFGLIAVIAGIASAMVMNTVLGLDTMSTEQLLQTLESDSSAMGYVTLSIVFQALEACGVPIFSFLLAEGAAHTSSYRDYLLRVTGVAFLSEIPFDLVMSGKLWNTDSQNPAFAMVLCLIMLYFFRRYPEKKASHIAIKATAILGAFLWSNMLSITHGACCVLLTAILWALRGRRNWQTLAGIVVMLLCCIFSPFYVMGLLGFMVINFYSGQKGSGSRIVNYLSYPVILLVFGLLSLTMG